MAKNLINSLSFTVLLVVLVVASTGILKSEASCDGSTCPPGSRVFLDECPAAHGKTNAECCQCCAMTFGCPPVCYAVIEGTDRHCHCYKHV